MKLELKHIAPYLPYGLRTVNFNTNGLIDRPLFSEVIPANILGFIDGSTESKIILRPLSDLQNKELDFWIEFGNKLDELSTEYLIESLVEKTFYAKDIHFSFKVYETLFEMHFDVFGLIPQGLAIDINTLKQ